MHDEDVSSAEETPTAEVYEAPAIESVLTAEELAREVQYAGMPSIP